MKLSRVRIVHILAVLALFSILGAALAGPALADGRPDLVVAVQKLPPTLEPMGENSNVHWRLVYNIAESLIYTDYAHGRKLVPGLAESWRRVDDRTIEFKLRRGVKFHDGSEMTAEDVAFSLGNDRLFHKDRGWRLGQMFLGTLEPPVVVDDYTVRISSKTPDFLLEKRLGNYMSEIVSKKAFEAAGGWQEWGRKPVTTGPYKVDEFKTGDYIKLVAHDDYWGPKAPVKSITFKAVPEVAARVAGLKTGEFHIITDIPPDQLQGIDQADGCSAVGGPIPNIRSVVFDSTNDILKSPELRQAMAMAVDRQLIADSFYYGRTTVPNGFQMKVFGDMYIADFKGIKYDPEKAKALIKKSGYKGQTIHYRVLPDYYTLEVATAEAMVDMWKAVGLNVVIDMKENWAQILANDETRHLVNVSNTAYYDDPVGQMWRRAGPQCWVRQDGKYGGPDPVFNLTPEFDELGKVLETSTELETRRKAFARMLEIAEYVAPVQINLHAMTIFYGKRDELNWTPNEVETMDLSARALSFK